MTDKAKTKQIQLSIDEDKNPNLKSAGLFFINLSDDVCQLSLKSMGSDHSSLSMKDSNNANWVALATQPGNENQNRTFFMLGWPTKGCFIAKTGENFSTINSGTPSQILKLESYNEKEPTIETFNVAEKKSKFAELK